MLEVKELVSGYPENGFFLKGISFAVKSGEILGVIGPNGSGKTTLLKTISRELYPIKGQILLQGRDIRHFKYKQLARQCAVVSQQTGENSRGFTVREYVLLGRIPYRDKFRLMENDLDLRTLDAAMESADIQGLADRDISCLSGGEKQRVAIARALCQAPALLLLDEPTSYLDIGHQVEILDLLKKLNISGLTVVMVMHDLNLASLYCDRLILMDKGSICATGIPEEIISKEIIEKTYKTPVEIIKNPVNSKPVVTLITGSSVLE